MSTTIKNLTKQINEILPLIKVQVKQALAEVPAGHTEDYFCGLPEETQKLHFAVTDLYFALLNVGSYEDATADALQTLAEYADEADPYVLTAAQNYIEAFGE